MFFGAQKVVAFIFTLLRAGSATKATKARGREGGDNFRLEKSSLGTLKAEKKFGSPFFFSTMRCCLEDFVVQKFTGLV